MNGAELSRLQALALRVREHILRMATEGGCFAGASLSCTDLLVFLYGRFLAVGPRRLADPERDYLLLSKGHDVPALYATCAELGFFDVGRLRHHLRAEDQLYWHPNRLVPGVEFHSGSLGHLLPVALGVAYDVRLRKGPNRVVVVMGDGELNEGSVWEALLVARAHGLAKLVLVIDRNGIQANARTEELIPLEPLAQKFAAFGCGVRTVDGHDFDALDRVFSGVPFEPDAPSVIIARTVRGRGVPSLEDRVDRWFCNFTSAEVQALIAELHGQAPATIASEPLLVR
ncbi:MAG TPA: 1-deoxy-D-xylulose-5-phosphate synthase N-terminal domain-containing protein [Candidatus Dormibacteraeota bacterium]|nr:1-deoxy-D-xylulose-5-phosphate synthase N-terminal domain-containing protein [Candidatus Dormibacteraeota bacterium]